MCGRIELLLLCGAMVGVSAGCYKDVYRGDEPFGVSGRGTPPASAPADVASTATGPATTGPAVETAAAGMSEGAAAKIRAIIETNLGHMEVELWPDQAPETVANFVKLARSGFYENLPCHRMLRGFIVQFGKPVDPTKARALEPIKGEFSETLKHEGGTLSMARRPSDPDSATSQFFICFKPTNDIQRRALATMDGKYAIFGKVVRGLDVLSAIEAVPTTTQPMGPGRSEPSKPTRTILLRTVRIVD